MTSGTLQESLSAWFKGFEAALEVLASDERKKLMAHCGKSYASLSLEAIFKKSWEESNNNLPQCIRLIQKCCAPEFLYEPVDEPGVPEEKCYDVIIPHCTCALVTEGFVSNPLMCECTKEMFLSAWESVFGKGNVSVEKKQTILGGASTCILRCTFR